MLFECIKDGLQHLAAGTRCSHYTPCLPWDAVGRDIGLSSACAHLRSQAPSHSPGQIPNDDKTNAHDHSELLKEVLGLLDVSMADFSPELSLTAYGLDSFGATKISQMVRPYADISQMYFLLGLSWNQLEERIKSQSATESALKTSPMDDVLETVARYSKEFTPHTGTEPLPSQDVVLVTGTTGTIGSCVLAQLVADAKIDKVYALNREAPAPLDARQRIVLRDRGLDPSVIDSPKVVLLEGALSQPKLGLADGLYEQLRTSITHVIHIGRFIDWCYISSVLKSAQGWRIDFLMGISGFEDDIKGIRNLIDLALSSSLSSPPHFLFTSSPAVLHSTCRPLRSSTLTHYLFIQTIPGRGQRLKQQPRSKRRLVLATVNQNGSPRRSWRSREWRPTYDR